MYINEETISVNVPHTIQSSRNENVVYRLVSHFHSFCGIPLYLRMIFAVIYGDCQRAFTF